MPLLARYLSNVQAIAKALLSLPPDRYLLAVSGGRDSMALLIAFADVRPHELCAVATFDHGTGPMATQAAELVVHTCLTRSIPVVAGRADGAGRRATQSESAWRTARWGFLRAVAEERRAVVVTAHTLEDQAETVAMRILRGASARGLAGMAAPTPGIVRPLLGVSRAALAAFATAGSVRYVEDPSNARVDFLRNRMRADLLARIEALRPGFSEELVGIGARAAVWRAELANLVDGLGVRRVGHAVVVEAPALTTLSSDSLSIVWPEIAARGGVVMDRRGVARLAHWTARASAGQRVPLSGGAVVERLDRTFVLRRPAREARAVDDDAR